VDTQYGTTSKLALPILVTSFNRPECLIRVFSAIRNAGYSNIFFASDGPRNLSDSVKIKECEGLLREFFPNTTSDHILTRVSNLGCRQAMYENVIWFFSKVEFGVILEDDCLPANDFFDFMFSTLIAYEKSSDVFIVSGYNPTSSMNSSLEVISCRKSIYPLVWGWGSWANRISKYVLDFSDYRKVVKSGQNLAKHHQWSSAAKLKWSNLMYLAGSGKIDTWDYSLTASAWRQDQYSLHPNQNLIENLGFGPDATHTTKKAPNWATRKFSNQRHILEIFPDIDYTEEDSKQDKIMERELYTLTFSGLLRLYLGQLKIKILDNVKKFRTTINPGRRFN
jgi:hypothetical protein